MNVCHILAGYFPGYPAPYEYAHKLTECGVKVDAVALGYADEATEEQIDGVHVRRIRLDRGTRGPIPRTIHFAGAVLKALEGRRYDLIHVYAFRGCSLLPVRGRKLSSHWLLDIRSGNVASNRFRSHLANRVTALESRFFGRLVALDEQVGRSVLGAQSRFATIPLGTDMQKFNPERAGRIREQLGLASDQVVAIYSGSLASQRRLEQIVKGFAAVAGHYPNLQALIVGEGDALADLQKLAHSLGIAERILFTGRVHYEHVQDYIADSDIGLAYVPITPQYDHQPPLKTVEYLACGLATLATRTQGNCQFVRDGENALLIDDTPEAVAAGIARLMDDPALLSSLRAKARCSVESYDWRLIVRDRLLPLYREIIR